MPCERCELLEEQFRQLKQSLVPRLLFPYKWGLIKSETSILGSLYSSPTGFRSKATLLACAQIFHGSDDVRVVQTRICKLREKLKPYEIVINTRIGEGYFLPSQSRALIARALAENGD